jgi:peroxiredoxin
MKKSYDSIRLAAIALLAAGMVMACAEATGREGPALQIGQPAPGFSVADTNGKTHSLDQYRGKWVVLEWLNHDCPYVRKHYNGDAMQALQKKYAGQGVIWLSVVSSAPGKQGHFPNERANQLTKEKNAAPHAVLVDSAGTMGRAYDARTTPHMFVIDPAGNIVYMGGIDDKPTAKAADLQTARPHVDIALQEAMAGKPVSVPTSQPYGCNVKY